MAYRLTRSAEQDLIDIYIEGYRKFGVAQAEAYAEKLKKTFELLSDFPGLSRDRDEFKPPVRIHGCGVHVIIYDVDEHGDVVIIRIRHGHDDWLVHSSD